MQYLTHFSEICKNWENRTLVRLLYEEANWTVEVKSSGRIRRFGKGWDDFIEDNDLAEGNVLQFRYTAPYTFQVSRFA